MKKRTIKYRAKRKRDGVWVYGLEKPKKSNEITLGQFFNQVADRILDRNTLGQYIGLKDKKDKKEVEIYEGDIVKLTYGGTKKSIEESIKDGRSIEWFADKIIEIKWMEYDNPESWCQECKRHICGFPINIENYADTREVIGNIYENKNLLN